jgi:hypothetical protein
VADEKREFARNYESCYIGLPLKSGAYRAFLVRGINGDGTLAGTAVSRNYKETTVRHPWDFVEKHMVQIVPSQGYFNVEMADAKQPWTTALYVRVEPSRQYRKGLPADSRVVWGDLGGSPYFSGRWNKLAEEAECPGVMEPRVLAAHLAQSKGRNLVGIRQAIGMVESGEHHSVAFSKFFCVALRPQIRVPCLIYNQELVGVFCPDNPETVWALDKVQHLADFFNKRWGYSMKNLADYKRKTR